MALIFIALATAISYAAPAKKQSEPAPQTHDDSAQAEQIKLIIAKYGKSVDDVDTTLASKIWWDSPEVSFIHPLGHEHGFGQIKQNIYQHLMGDTFSERKLTPHDITVHVYGDCAWAEFYWDFAAKFRKDGRFIITHGRETQIYRKFPTRWGLVHVHYSGMPTKSN